MIDEEINRKFDHVWEAIKEMRNFRTKALTSIIISGVLLGLIYGEARVAISGNAEAIKKKPTAEQMKTTQDNQEALAKGINCLGRDMKKVAESLGVELEDRPIVEIRVDGDGGD